MIPERLSDLWPIFDDFVVKNTNFDFKLTQMYQYIQYFENLIRILLNLFIINKIKFFSFFYSKNYCMQSSSTKFFILFMMNKSNKIKSMGSDPMRDRSWSGRQKKRIRLREILRRHFVFKKFIEVFSMYLNTCRNMYAKPDFNIFIHLLEWSR